MRGVGGGIRTGGGGGIGGRASDMSGSVIVSVIVRLEVVAASLTGASTKNGAGVAHSTLVAVKPSPLAVNEDGGQSDYLSSGE